MSPIQKLIIGCIRRYQSKGGGLEVFRVDCNFHPTCSEYTRQAVQTYGALKGLYLGWKRIRRCNDPDRIHPITDQPPVHNFDNGA